MIWTGSGLSSGVSDGNSGSGRLARTGFGPLAPDCRTGKPSRTKLNGRNQNWPCQDYFFAPAKKSCFALFAERAFREANIHISRKTFDFLPDETRPLKARIKGIRNSSRLPEGREPFALAKLLTPFEIDFVTFPNSPYQGCIPAWQQSPLKPLAENSCRTPQAELDRIPGRLDHDAFTGLQRLPCAATNSSSAGWGLGRSSLIWPSR